MIAKLHVLKAQAGMDDDTYRGKLELATGQRSASDCSDAQLQAALAMFHTKQNQNNSYTRKAKALFISAFNLGALESGTDAALDAFVQRQTGKQRLGFLTPAEANTVSEALKAICARHGFVVPASDKEGLAPRRSLVKAQWATLHKLGAVRNGNDAALDEFTSRKYVGCHGSLINLTVKQLDQAIRDFGRWIRREKAAVGDQAGQT